MTLEFGIGEVARKAGVSVQTLRHYDQLGLLRPSRVTAAGYRLYSSLECARLDLIRTLRDVGFDLPTIALLLRERSEPRAAVQLQLDAVNTQMRALARQRAVLKAVVCGEQSQILPRLQRLKVLVNLSRLEREAFLAQQLGWNPEQPWGESAVWEAAVMHLPETLTETQLEDWLELAQIAADPGVQAMLQRQRALLDGVENAARETWFATSSALIQEVASLLESGVADADARAFGQRWLEGLARAFGTAADASFARWALASFEATSDERMDRYWELVTRLKGQTFSPSYARAWPWLMDGVRAWTHFSP